MTEYTPESEARIAEGQKLLDQLAAARAAKEAGERAYWKKYREQLEKGNSNIGGGAKRSKNRARPFRFLQ